MSDFLAFGAYNNQGQDVKVEMGGASVQNSVAGAEQSSEANVGQGIPESIVVVD